MTDLDKLIKAVEAGDLMTGNLLRASFIVEERIPSGFFYHERNADLAVAAYRGSLDAAKLLHDALLPGWWWVKPDGHESGTIRVVGPDNGDCYPSAIGKNADPARAWLLAILKAYRSQIQTQDV